MGGGKLDQGMGSLKRGAGTPLGTMGSWCMYNWNIGISNKMTSVIRCTIDIKIKFPDFQRF